MVGRSTESQAKGSIMRYTVIGAQGFIGGLLAGELSRRGEEVFVPCRDESLNGIDLGIVYYCIGLTADFRSRLHDTVNAHVCVLNEMLDNARFTRLVYLSSTRVYSGLTGWVDESARLIVNPNDPSDVYNLSKLMGEAACLHSGRPACVARLSNVVGHDFKSSNFLFDLIREACDDQVIHLRSAPESAKDYIMAQDVVEALISLAKHPDPRSIYNLASGQSLHNKTICGALAKITGCHWHVGAAAPLLEFPHIDVSQARAELGLDPALVLESLPELVDHYRKKRSSRYNLVKTEARKHESRF